MIGAKKFNKGRIVLDGCDIKEEPLDAKASYGYCASEPACYEERQGQPCAEADALCTYGRSRCDHHRI